MSVCEVRLPTSLAKPRRLTEVLGVRRVQYVVLAYEAMAYLPKAGCGKTQLCLTMAVVAQVQSHRARLKIALPDA